MGRELNHQEAAELLGAHALDALDLGERDAVESHLAGCGWCQAEIMEHREVAALLTSSLAVPPPGLWTRIAAAMEETPPPLDLAAVIALKPSRGNVPVRAAMPSGSRRVARLRAGISTRVAAVAAVAAVVVVGVAGLFGPGLLDDGSRVGEIAAVHGEELQRTMDAAMSDPSAIKVALRSSDGVLFADAWVLPDGRGYLVSNNLPVLASDRTYQLWALAGVDRVSVGLLGSGPGPSAFRATGPVTALAITEEVGGGVAQPTRDPLVVGHLS